MTKQKNGLYCHKLDDTKLTRKMRRAMIQACGSVALFLTLMR